MPIPYARRVQRHVLVLSVSGASTGNSCSGPGKSNNHRNLDRTPLTRSGATPVHLSTPAYSDLLLDSLARAFAARKI
jgi:hypothetical protein